MRSLILLVSAGLFFAGDFVSAITETETTSSISTSTIESTTKELHYVDRDVQSRRKNWDGFSILLMMINSECGPHGEVHLPDCGLLHKCKNRNYDDCAKLCEKTDSHHHSHYSEFCDTDTYFGDSSSSVSASSTSSVDAYNGSSTPAGFTNDGAYAATFQFWMVAVAASVGMALVAVHMGQRRERPQANDQLLMGAEVHGSVGRRVAGVSALMDGVLGGTSSAQSGGGGTHVEMSEYQLEGSEPARSSSYTESEIV